MPLEPGKVLENAIRTIDTAFRYAGIHYWLHFGALFGLCQREGVIPDADFDCCVYYGTDWKRIVKAFSQYGYTLSKAMLNDVDQTNVVYCGFNKPGCPHICCSFWYLHDGIRYYCHDTHHEIEAGQEGIPASGYYFKGMPDHYVATPDMFKRVEWPGVSQAFKISVPLMPALDYMYPGWPYTNQRYTIRTNEIIPEQMRSIYRHGAISPYMVHVKSMAQWNDSSYIKSELEKGNQTWKKKLKELRTAN
jgi:hypothetical protein